MANNYSDKIIIVVLGMHRSGTSVIARGLAALGINLGDNLVPENWDNERGFWEDAEIVAFNENLQEKLGYIWFGSTVVDGINWKDKFIIEAKEQAKQLLANKIEQNQIYAFKDPRTAMLIEFWLEVFHELQLSPYYVIALRNPLEVAASLYKRNDLPKEKSLLLWAASIYQSISFTRNETRLVVSYNELLESPLDQLSRISTFFNLQHVDTASDSISQYCQNYLTKDLHHNYVSDSELYDENIVPTVVRDIYLLLKEYSIGDNSINEKHFLDQWDSLEKRYIDIFPVLRYMNCLEQQLLAVSQDKETFMKAKDEELAVKQAELKDAMEQINQLYASYSWKVTRPLRKLNSIRSRIKGR